MLQYACHPHESTVVYGLVSGKQSVNHRHLKTALHGRFLIRLKAYERMVYGAVRCISSADVWRRMIGLNTCLVHLAAASVEPEPHIAIVIHVFHAVLVFNFPLFDSFSCLMRLHI